MPPHSVPRCQLPGFACHPVYLSICLSICLFVSGLATRVWKMTREVQWTVESCECHTEEPSPRKVLSG
jgi:hypothetical protein